MALEFIKTFNDNKSITFSDSLSGLKALNHSNSNSEDAQIQNLLQKDQEMSRYYFFQAHKSQWVTENEKADTKGKRSAQS